jgi:DNA-binding response OmpR family regulator
VVNELVEEQLDLTALEYRLLLHFIKNRGRVFSRDQLMTAVWSENIHLVDRTVDTHICHIRKKISSSRFSIESVHGVGYRLIERA